jgi:hypothetical protein
MHPLQNIINGNVNGASFITIDTRTVVPLRGGKKNIFQGRVSKLTIGSNVMVFQNKTTNGYENMVRRRLIQEGKDPDSFVLSPRVWGERIPNTPFVTHNGKLYLEVIFLKCGHVTYLLDGEECDINQIDGFVADKQEAEQGGLDNKVIIRTFSVDSINAVTINHQRFVI